MNTPEDDIVIKAMVRYGGSFAQALAVAAQCADAQNLLKLKVAFPEMWAQYYAMGQTEQAP